jgi:hypothetical protein
VRRPLYGRLRPGGAAATQPGGQKCRICSVTLTSTSGMRSAGGGPSATGVPGDTVSCGAADPWRGRRRSDSRCDGGGDRRAAAPARRAAPTGGPASLHAGRPDGSGGVWRSCCHGSLEGLPGHPVDAAALAPGADPPAVDISGHRATPRTGPPGGCAGAANGPGQRAMGLPAHRGGMPQARRDGVRDVGAHDPASTPPRPGTPPRRCHLDTVSSRPGRRSVSVHNS